MRSRLWPRAGLLTPLFAISCIGGTTQGGIRDLVIGSRVEGKGSLERLLPPKLNDIEEIDPHGSTVDKVEIIGPVTSTTDHDIVVAGQHFKITDKTTYEDSTKQTTERFTPPPDSWVKLKARRKSDAFEARTIRQAIADDHFEIEGYVTRLEPSKSRIGIGGLDFQVGRDALVAALDPADRIFDSDPMRYFLADDQKGVPLTVQLGQALRVGGIASVSLDRDLDRDLDRSRQRDRSTMRLDAKLDALLGIDTKGSFVFLEATFGQRHRFEENDVDTRIRYESVSRAFAYYAFDDNLRLQVGRQDFDEEREWLYDEVLDGARLRWQVGSVQLEGAAAMGREVLEEANSTQDTQTFIGMASHSIDDDQRLRSYFVQRKDTNPVNFEPYLVGVSSHSRPSSGLGHWVELAYAGGYVGRKRIRGHAADLGLLYRFSGTTRPTIYGGVAFGSGRADANSKLGFRQTGLQDNNGKFGGVTSFRYYGEMLEPELANLWITTLGAGLRPFRPFSVDALFHTYRQDVASTTFYQDGLRANPNGMSSNIGTELDIVVGYRVRNRVSVELIGARFEPGRAYDNRTTAYKLAVTLRLGF